MRKVQIYVENQLIDLFQDESIEVKSSVQNINDIAKVFTDFSQSFTVPASDINNAAFGFYYNNDNNTFDANTRVACRIEIDLIPFREGKLQLEGSIIKNGQVEAYKVNFYGDVVTLKDLFGENKLSNMDYTSLSVAQSGATVLSSLTSTAYQDVRFPLISSDHLWTYGDANTYDISDITKPIVYTELFPAISDSKILDLIATTYGVTFTGNFLTDKRFTNSYTWWKNREAPDFTVGGIDVPFNLGDLSCTADFPNALGISEVNFDYTDVTTLTQPADWQSWLPTAGHKLEVYFIPATAVTYYLDVYIDGVFSHYETSNAAALFTIDIKANNFGLDSVYTFKARAVNALNFDCTIKYSFEAQYVNTSSQMDLYEASCLSLSLSNSITNIIDFASAAPDIKVSEWFSGTLKEFNLTCYPVDTLTFQIEPLEDWYAGGDTVDITQHVDMDQVEVDRAKMYNEISFEWQKSKSFINTFYSGFNGKEYGDLKQIFPNNDGGKYNIKLPFENLLFSNFDTVNSNLQVGFCLTNAPDHKPYIPKPIKLYLNDEANPVSFYFDSGSVAEVITYMPFGQSMTNNNNQYSMNFGLEIDSLTALNVPNSLYKTYYEPYLLNLFSPKTRKVTVKCILPIDVLTRLSLDDAIIIRDKKFRINDMTTNLTTGMVKLVLLSDWVADRGDVTPIPCVTDSGGTVNISIKPPKGGWVDIADPIEVKFVTTVPTIPATNITTQTTLVITVPVNTSGLDRTNTIVYTGYYSNGTVAWVRTIVICQDGSSSFLLTDSGGYILQDNLDKIKL